MNSQLSIPDSQLSTPDSQLLMRYILDGLEAELALERELGVKSIEIDRSLLIPPAPQTPQIHQTPQLAQPSKPSQPAQAPQPSQPSKQSQPPQAPQTHKGPQPPQPSQPPQPPQPTHPTQLSYDFVFLHDRPLTNAGAEMIAKITGAMGRTADSAPVIVDAPRPKAKIYVVLGDRALKKWFPGVHASPGMWISGGEGETALVTYSPNYFLRFGEITPAVKKIKADMWNSLKGVLQRLALQR